MVVSGENIKSLAKARAIHRPEGWIASHRAKVAHLLEGKMTEAEYIAFDILLHAVGWDKRKPDYGRIEKNFTWLHKHWFPIWSRQYVNKVMNGLASKLYIEFDGEWIVIPNFAKYQAVTDKKGATTVADGSQKPPKGAPTGAGGATTGAQTATVGAESATTVAPEVPQTRTGSESYEPKQSNKLKPNFIPPIVPQSNRFDVMAAFEEWWAAYPRKKAKGTCRTLWKEICPDEEQFEKMMAVLAIQKESENWKVKGWVPNPEKWLDEERWEDDVDTGSRGSNIFKLENYG